MYYAGGGEYSTFVLSKETKDYGLTAKTTS